MDESRGGGCALAGLLLVLGVVLAGVVIGAPNIASIGLSWDNSAAIAREANATERTRIQANRDIRVAEEWNGTMRDVGTVVAQVGAVCVGLWVAGKAIPAIFASIATAFAAWAARPHRPAAPPATIVMLAAPTLAAAPEARLEWSEEDGAWVIVNDRTQTVKLLEDRRQK